MMLTLLVSYPNPAPLSFSEFSTIISSFFLSSFFLAFSSSLPVSSAKPTSHCPCDLVFPRPAAMSSVGFSFISRSSLPLFSFSVTGSAGVKSLTAAASTAPCIEGNNSWQRLLISEALTTSYTLILSLSTPWFTGPSTRCTSAPASARLSASLMPILPDE